MIARFPRGPGLVLLVFLAVVTFVVGTGNSGFLAAIRPAPYIEQIYPTFKAPKLQSPHIESLIGTLEIRALKTRG